MGICNSYVIASIFYVISFSKAFPLEIPAWFVKITILYPLS
jgi:hypothetical protein